MKPERPKKRMPFLTGTCQVATTCAMLVEERKKNCKKSEKKTCAGLKLTKNTMDFNEERQS